MLGCIVSIIRPGCVPVFLSIRRIRIQAVEGSVVEGSVVEDGQPVPDAKLYESIHDS
jgi:hypothetical protein